MGEFHILAKHDDRQGRSMMTARVITTILRPPKLIRTYIVVMTLAVIMPICSLLVLSNHN